MSYRIYQFEVTNACNARCTYCPHDKMTHPIGYASMATVESVIQRCKEAGQKYIALHHMGEPLLHQRLPSIVWAFTQAGIRTELSTNGKFIQIADLVVAAGLARLRIAVDYFYNDPGYCVNLERFLRDVAPRYANITQFILHTIVGNDLSRFAGIAPNVFLSQKAFDNWAGGVEGPSLLKKGECYFKKHNYRVVLWDGRIVPCCLDYNAEHVQSDVRFKIVHDENKGCELCSSCVGLQFADQGEWAK